MKIRNILIAGLVATSLASCDDYLDVETPSAFDYDYAYGTMADAEMALNGLYAKLNVVSSPITGGNLILNSDLDFNNFSGETSGTNNVRRFDCTPESSTARTMWQQSYNAIEHCNIFIDQMSKSEFVRNGDEDALQMLGEAKCLRAIFYFEMVWYFGDIPYSLEPSYNREGDEIEIFPIVDRHQILDDLIADLKEAAPQMKLATDITNGIEHASKEFAWSMIARIAMTNGGYTLLPDKNNRMSYGKMERPDNYLDYYKTAADYCDSVMNKSNHNLTKSFIDVFVDECNYVVNNTDDPIFEIPYTKENSGNIGYVHGYRFNSQNGSTNYSWGETSGAVGLHPLVRYLFDEEDIRRDYLIGMWNYTFDGIPTTEPNAYKIYNNKWSKLWSNSPLGNNSTGSTGINFPYMRYTDVLLTYAEAINELEGGVAGPNGQKAIDAFKEVRSRAFRNSTDAATKVDAYIAAAAGDKTKFRDAVLNERMFEFAGENLRWKDLVRNNLYAEKLAYAFLRMFGVAENNAYPSPNTESVSRYDGKHDEFWDQIPITIGYKIAENPSMTPNNPKSATFPNNQLDVLEFYNLYENKVVPSGSEWQRGSYYENWCRDGEFNGSILYSYYGFVRGVDPNSSEVVVVNNGTTTPLPEVRNASTLPVVRYILPYPQSAIQDAGGAYVNYYGY